MLKKFFVYIAVICFLLVMGGCAMRASSQELPKPSAAAEESLKRFIQKWGQERNQEDNPPYIAVFRDLNDDGQPEAIVYMTGDDWCGSGGCPTLVLTPAGSSWKLVSSLSVAHTPIRVLSNKFYGWHSLGVMVGGGGIINAYEAELRFNGKKYPYNPSMPPARRAKKGAAGDVVISTEMLDAAVKKLPPGQ
jgi:hypothetical protein